MEALLEVAAFPDDGIAAMSFNFWHRLARYLSSGFSPQSLEDASSTEVWGPPRRSPAKPCLGSVLLPGTSARSWP